MSKVPNYAVTDGTVRFTLYLWLPDSRLRKNSLSAVVPLAPSLTAVAGGLVEGAVSAAVCL